jgi:hypothetical protein
VHPAVDVSWDRRALLPRMGVKWLHQGDDLKVAGFTFESITQNQKHTMKDTHVTVMSYLTSACVSLARALQLERVTCLEPSVLARTCPTPTPVIEHTQGTHIAPRTVILFKHDERCRILSGYRDSSCNAPLHSLHYVTRPLITCRYRNCRSRD